jgi:hypothetical protein
MDVEDPDIAAWKRAEAAANRASRIKFLRIAASGLVGGIFGTLTLVAQLYLTDADATEKEERLRRGQHVITVRSRRSIPGAEFVVFPAIAGTIGFLGVFFLLGGRLSEEHKRGLGLR